MTTWFAVALAAASAQAQPAPAVAPTPDYTAASSWLCRGPELGVCDQDLTTTVIAADGSRKTEPFRRAANPSFDCFYVYPTVSLDRTPNSDMTAGDEERRVIQAQAARFGQVCRVFAPLYRQVTLTALRAAMTGQPLAADREMAYNDVKAAWDTYLARDNGGRGVVLIGHSQGSGVLKALIAKEIEGKPVANRIIAAYPIGTNIAVPEGKTVGGDLKQTPLCTRADETGCVVSFVSFRDTAPPPAKTRFARVETAGQAVACVNPAALAGDPANPHAYLLARASASSTPQPAWTRDGAEVTTPFVSAPGLLSVECVNKDGASYLAVKTNANPADARTDAIGGDVQAMGQVQADWGLHLIDMNVVMGDMIALVERQAAAWSKTRTKVRPTP